MATKAKPEVRIELGGKVRTMVFDLNAMATYEEITGKNILKGLDTENLGARELRALLFACLCSNEVSLTLNEVGSWITPESMGEVTEELTQAFGAGVPESETPPSPLVRESGIQSP